ncbi:MAG: YihY/virulence factor BrkB family protein [Steroidobacteraceae bacterium]
MWERVFGWFERYLFGPSSSATGIGALLLRLLRYPFAVLRDLSRGEVNLRAMGLVYTTLLTLIPLVAFAFAILKSFGAHRDLEPVIFEFFRPVGAAAGEITARVMQFADNVSSGIVGSVGLALLVWTLLGTIKKVEDSFNFLWRVDLPRSFPRRVTEYLALLIIGPVLLVGFLGLTHAALGAPQLRRFGNLAVMEKAIEIAVALGPYAMVTAVFTGMYMFVPNTRVAWRPALIGAMTAGVLWAAVGKLFTAMVLYTARLTLVYAGFAIIVAALLWTYFGWLILLVGALLSFYLQNPSYLRLGLMPLRLSASEMETLALQIMYLVGERHAHGQPLLTMQSLSDRLAVPGIGVSQVVAALEKANMLLVTDDDVLVPARDIDAITLEDILEVARNCMSGRIGGLRSLQPVDRLGLELGAARRAALAHRTLGDLIGNTDEAALSAPR